MPGTLFLFLAILFPLIFIRLMSIESINPTTGKQIKTYPQMDDSQVASIIDSVQNNFLTWRSTSFKLRAECLLKAAEILVIHKNDYVKLMAEEMGKPISQGLAEIDKSAWGCRYYAENAESFLKDTIVNTEAKEAFISYQPLGIVFGIMPWNFPFWQVFRAAAPTLMAGNAFILKHSSNVTACALAIEAVFKQAGFPSNLFRTLITDSSKVGSIIEHKHIKAVTLTGSCRAGAAVAAQAGAQIKKVVLELGGSDPYLILADADIKDAAKKCVTSRMLNAGQSCIAAKRFIVDQSIIADFTQCFIQEMKSYVCGDPLDPNCNLGPMARSDLRDDLHSQVQKSIKAGAKCLLGGDIPPGPGAYYPPTILTNVHPGMPAYDEEVFGPVAAIISAKDENDAIRIANDTPFGLGSAIFTQDLKKGRRIASQDLQAGSCFVNDFVKSDPRLPFGGINHSGYGRELGTFGIHEFVNIKTISVL